MPEPKNKKFHISDSMWGILDGQWTMHREGDLIVMEVKAVTKLGNPAATLSRVALRKDKALAMQKALTKLRAEVRGLTKKTPAKNARKV